jgi:hypothetical protein
LRILSGKILSIDKSLKINLDYCSYIVIWKKGYQQVQEPRGTSVIKVKGVAKVSGNGTSFNISKNLR